MSGKYLGVVSCATDDQGVFCCFYYLKFFLGFKLAKIGLSIDRPSSIYIESEIKDVIFNNSYVFDKSLYKLCLIRVNEKIDKEGSTVLNENMIENTTNSLECLNQSTFSTMDCGSRCQSDIVPGK